MSIIINNRLNILCVVRIKVLQRIQLTEGPRLLAGNEEF